MKEFYLESSSLSYSPMRECQRCPHRHNSLLIAENITPNVFARYEVRHAWCNKFQRYPTLEVARDAMRIFCDFGFIFKKKYKSLKMSEYLSLSIRYNVTWRDDRCFINKRLYAEIVQLF